jgi:Holliday junction resolvasome RuvABC endonuclease subunit
MFVIGLDPSLTGSALAVLNQKTAKVEYINTFKNKLDSTTRLAYLKTEIISVISEFGKGPNPIFIEGYGFSFRGRDFQLAELGGILRLSINECLSKPYIEVPPMTLKLFITGKGNSNKNIMLEQVFRKYHMGSENLTDDNQVDAYALARFGIAYLSWSKYPNDYTGTQKEIQAFKKIAEPVVLDTAKAYLL